LSLGLTYQDGLVALLCGPAVNSYDASRLVAPFPWNARTSADPAMVKPQPACTDATKLTGRRHGRGLAPRSYFALVEPLPSAKDLQFDKANPAVGLLTPDDR
jgi:hypothetical protein